MCRKIRYSLSNNTDFFVIFFPDIYKLWETYFWIPLVFSESFQNFYPTLICYSKATGYSAQVNTRFTANFSLGYYWPKARAYTSCRSYVRNDDDVVGSALKDRPSQINNFNLRYGTYDFTMGRLYYGNTEEADNFCAGIYSLIVGINMA